MNNAGRIGFLIKGEYDNAVTYDFLDVVYYNGASYVAKKPTIGNAPARNNEYWQIFAEGGTLTENSDISDTTVAFTESESRVNVASGEKMSILFGKVKKWLSDMGTAAFCAVVNNLTTTADGYVLDARQGKKLNDQISKLNSDLNAKQDSFELGNSTITDLDSIFAGCIWYIAASSSGAKPFADYGFIIAFKSTEASVLQIAIPYGGSTNVPKWRTYINAKWQAWKPF